jgi:hypothetical protein
MGMAPIISAGERWWGADSTSNLTKVVTRLRIHPGHKGQGGMGTGLRCRDLAEQGAKEMETRRPL